MSEFTYQLNNVSKKFGKRVILNDLCYRFESGKIYAILGESGSGKTTLLNILGCIDNNYSGNLSIDNNVVNKKIDNYEIRNNDIGFVFQSYYLLDYLSVEENIRIPTSYSTKKFDEGHFKNLLVELSIDNLLDEKVNYLSGGEKQRISLARALINDPRIIICDEPTGNLDLKNANQVIGILKRYISKERIIIVVTHDKNIAFNCDRILELKDCALYEKEK
jgi:putative ABC transport system permease protein